MSKTRRSGHQLSTKVDMRIFTDIVLTNWITFFQPFHMQMVFVKRDKWFVI